MPLLLALNVFIQLCFVVHAYRSGAPRYWVFVILAFPVAGCLAYYLFEVFPRSREAVGARRAARNLARAFDPQNLRGHGRARGGSGTTLPRACACGGSSEAIAYRSARRAYQDDPHTALRLARRCRAGAWDDAATVNACAATINATNRTTRLLHARVLEGRA
jgi:hypothetical protein